MKLMKRHYHIKPDYTAIKIMIASAVFGWVIMNLDWSQWIKTEAFISPLSDVKVIQIDHEVEVEVPVPLNCTTEKCKILSYLVEKFQGDADKAITMIRTCENSSFNPHAINKANRNKTWDVGIMMINVDPSNTDEVLKLQDYRYNIDRGYAKYKAHKNTFYLWTCGNRVGDYTYLNKLRGE